MCVLALAAAGGAAVVSYRDLASPVQVLQAYFAALRAGDAPKALGYGRAPTGDTTFLTSAVLRVQRQIAPLGAVTVTATRRDGPEVTLSISYSIGSGAAADPVREDVGLHQVSRHWLLDSTSAVVQVDVEAASHRATLAGAGVPGSAIALFPGAAPVTFDTDRLVQAPGSDRIRLGSTGDIRVIADVTAQGRSAVVAGLRAAMTRCLALGAGAPVDCPLTPEDDRAVPDSLRGTLRSVSVTAVPALVGGKSDGLVEVEATVAVQGRWTTLDFENLPVTHSGATTVDVSAQAYLSRPDVVRWVSG